MHTLGLGSVSIIIVMFSSYDNLRQPFVVCDILMQLLPYGQFVYTDCNCRVLYQLNMYFE